MSNTRNWGRDGASFCAAVKAQLQFATAMGGRMRTLELWLPLTFAASGFIWIAAEFHTLRRGAR
jgi:hypothetical protein